MYVPFSICIIPEIPYDIDKIVEAINLRTKRGSTFTILAVAEGAISKERSKMGKKELKKSLEESSAKYPSVSYEIAAEIEKRTGQEIRVTVPGHTQRGGSPVPYDRVFASRLGTKAAKLIIDEDYGYMVGIVNREITKIPLSDVAGKLKSLEPDATIIQEARMLGISFGD